MECLEDVAEIREAAADATVAADGKTREAAETDSTGRTRRRARDATATR
jgi:hypothetical protein